jgi:hypothetical protein
MLLYTFSKHFGAVGVAAVLTGCAGLPSIQKFERSFRRQHPGAEVLQVTSNVEVSDEHNFHDGHAVFDLTYREAGNPSRFVYERKFGTVTEGWVQISSTTKMVDP